MKDTTEAFAVLKAIAERERPEIVSFGDSETMHATGAATDAGSCSTGSTPR